MTLLGKLIERFRVAGYRHAYVESFLNSYVATQIKVLREQQGLTQAELAQRAEMRQSQISKLEDVNNSSWKISTLQRLAHAFDVVLVVRFESFGSVLPDIDSFGRASLERESFEADPVFSEAARVDCLDAVAAQIEQVQVANSTARILTFRSRDERLPLIDDVTTDRTPHYAAIAQ